MNNMIWCATMFLGVLEDGYQGKSYVFTTRNGKTCVSCKSEGLDVILDLAYRLIKKEEFKVWDGKGELPVCR